MELNECTTEFKEITQLFDILPSDRIVDVDGGKHFTVVCTEEGKVYGLGIGLSRAVDEELKKSGDGDSFEIKMALEAEGYKAKRVWGCDLYDNIWVLGCK